MHINYRCGRTMVSRRELLIGSLVMGARFLSIGTADSDRSREPRRELRRLEDEHGGRLGVAIRDTANTEPIAYRGTERFAMCSTFKFLAAAYVLARVDQKRESLRRRRRHRTVNEMPYWRKSEGLRFLARGDAQPTKLDSLCG